MGKLKLLIISFLPLLTSCQTQKEVETKIETNYDYSLISDKIVDYQNIFKFKSEDYYVYFYSESCGHCNEIKQDIIYYGLNHSDIYFVTYQNNIPTGIDTSSTIGITSLDNFLIKGTPSLIRIKNHILVKNIAGSSKVKEALKI